MQNIKELMTAKQVAEMFGYSQNNLVKNFKRTSSAIKKKYNVDIIKCKSANGTFYQIFEEQKRALTIYEEEKNIPITYQSLSFEAYEFIIFLALAASPQGVYRGTRQDLMKYIGLKKNKKNIQKLNFVLDTLVNNNYIGMVEDQSYIVVYLRTAVEKEMDLSINILRESRRIANQNNRQFTKIPQLIQVWQAVRLCEQNQPFTYADLKQITGLSYAQIRDAKRLLEDNYAFLSSRAGSYFKCLGMNVQLNGFFEEDKEMSDTNQ